MKPDELNEDFLTLLALTSDFIYFKDQDSRIRFCSQAMATLCGYRDWRDMIGKHDLEIFPEETARIYYEEELPIFREGKTLLNKIDPYIDTQGERRWVSTNKWPVFGADKKTVVGIFGISRDITDQRRAEAAMQRHSLRSELLLRTATDGIHVLDRKGNILEVNDSFCRMLGYSREEAMKLNVAQWDVRWSASELTNEVIPRVLGHWEVFETRHRRRDASIIDVEVSAAGVELDGEQVVFASSRDITERKRSDENLRRTVAELAEANRLKDIFTDILRHDLLNPANAMMLWIDVLVHRETDPAKTEMLKRVKQSAASLVEMTNNAARLARITSGHKLECGEADPVQLLRSLLPELEHLVADKNMELVDQSGEGFTARFSPTVKDVFANLISNAIKYSPKGTRIEVMVTAEDSCWLLSVKDQGPGVPDQHKSGIFNRFERLDKEGVEGSGLGLTITREIVRLHGGEIWVEDNPTGGSNFRVRIPRNPDSRSESQG